MTSSSPSVKLVVLGRDGVINEASHDEIIAADDWRAVDGSIDAIARLSRAGLRVVVATNQHGLRDGELDMERLNDIHQKMLALVNEAGGSIDAIFFSSTGDPDGQGRKQPKVTLLEQIRSRYRIDFKEMVVIGDQSQDLGAAGSVGARAILVQTGHGREVLGELHQYDGVTIYSDLASAVEALLN